MGTFERRILMNVLRLRDDAYGKRLHEQMESEAGKPVNMGQVYVALDRLSQKGFVTSAKGNATPQRGGRAKVIYTVSAEGMKALNDEYVGVAGIPGLLPAFGGER